MSDECVFSELGEEGEPWGNTPRERRIELNKRYNDKAESIVGKRLLSEYVPAEDECFPEIKRIGEVFECEYTHYNGTEWLEGHLTTPQELESMLDRVERLDIRMFMLPDNWEMEKKRIFESYGKRPDQLRHARGPVTLATSIYGIENLIYLMIDEEELAERFFNVICDVIIKMAEVMDKEVEYDEEKQPSGFSFADDNCYLLTPELYETFAYPVLKRVFERFCSNAKAYRYQHYDSEMGHLLPILAKLNLTGCNFGPTVLVDEIRKYMPKTRIDGCLAPFTFMRNNEDNIIKEVKRDCEMIKATNIKGLNLFTSGSINDGSLLTSMRTVMYAIQTYGRY